MKHREFGYTSSDEICGYMPIKESRMYSLNVLLYFMAISLIVGVLLGMTVTNDEMERACNDVGGYYIGSDKYACQPMKKET